MPLAFSITSKKNNVGIAKCAIESLKNMKFNIFYGKAEKRLQVSCVRVFFSPVWVKAIMTDKISAVF